MPGRSRLPMSVVVDVSNERLRLNRGEVALGDWPIGGIDVESRSDGFHFTFDGEKIVITVDDSAKFADELGAQRVASGPGASPAAVGDKGPVAPSSLFSRVSAIDPEELFADVKGRIGDLRLDLADDAVEPGVVFGRWMRLLKEINRRHGQGAMPMSIFYRLNTELLDLMPVPATPRPSAPLGASSRHLAK